MGNAAVNLMGHQQEGIDFLIGGRKGLLAFEQGLGKTLVAIEAFRRVKLEGSAGRLLVICPNSLKRNWVAEVEKFAPELTTEIVEGTPRNRRQAFSKTKADVVITSYETARTEITAILALLSRKPTVIVLDESHAAKNWRSLTSTAIRHLAPACAFRWLLSGTPVTNKPSDLFTQVEIIAPGESRLGSLEVYLYNVEADPESVRESVNDLVLRRTKEQCLDLPEKTFMDVRIDLPDWQRKLYNEMRNEMVCAIHAMSGEEYKAFASTALAQITRLGQIASNPSLLFPELNDDPGKFEAMDGIVEDLMAVPGRKVIIWSNYVATIEQLLKRYERFGVVAIYGGVEATARQDIAKSFQNDPAIRVLIANPAAAATGFTLTAASFTIYETLSWRYDFYAQSQDRNHRIGQTLPVTYMRLIAADTIEEAIIKALEKKSVLAGSLLGDQDAVPSVADLTKDEMCQLLMNNEFTNSNVCGDKQ